MSQNIDRKFKVGEKSVYVSNPCSVTVERKRFVHLLLRVTQYIRIDQFLEELVTQIWSLCKHADVSKARTNNNIQSLT